MTTPPVHGWTLHRDPTRAQLDRITECMWRAFATPVHPWLRIVAPVFGDTPADHAAALQAHQDRQWQDYRDQHDVSTWLFVTSDPHGHGEVLGAAEWKVFTSNPYIDGDRAPDADGWPEGEKREFAVMCLHQMNAPRLLYMTGPHTLLENMFVDPAHRRQGIGGALMQFGIDEADRLHADSFIEASPHARPLYERFGYRVEREMRINTACDHPSATWTRLTAELTGFVWYLMRRRGEVGDGSKEISRGDTPGPLEK